MIGRSRSPWRTYRGLALASVGALLISAACGNNPQLPNDGQAVEGGAGLGKACERNDDCSGSLLCGPDAKCVGACDVTGTSCGAEACLADGRCSEGLGLSCSEDGDCSEGLVCSSLKRCSAPCEPGATNACKGGRACRADGTCATDKDVVLGVGGGSNEMPGAGGAANCIDVEVTFEPQVPTVLLLIDRSGSMNAGSGFGNAVRDAVDAGEYELGDCPSNNNWRWNVVRDVLFNATRGIIKPLEDRVRFGMSLYTSSNGRVSSQDPEEIDPNKTCPELIEVPIALGNHQAMLDEFQCSDIAGDTPTGESLLAAAMTLQAFDEPGPKIIVLATDGEPDSCECPNFADMGNTRVPARCKENGVAQQVQADVVATAGDIYADGITIHVINVSTPTNAGLQAHLAEVAAAGGGEVYPGFSPGALTTAFDAIIDGVRSCKIDLDGEIADGKESSGTVTLDGEPLTLDDENGWQVNTPSQIELLGAACEAIKSGDHDLKIDFPCESFVPGKVH